MLGIAAVLARRSTCPKLAVGAVLVDTQNRILGSGYNGVPHGMPHCTEDPCGGADRPPGSDLCLAVHAEQNALLACADIYRISTLYVTHAPCLRCTKELLNTTCSRIVYEHEHPVSYVARDYWTKSGRLWRYIHEQGDSG